MTEANSDTPVFTETPFADAVRVAMLSSRMAPALILKVAEVAPAATVAAGGMLTTGVFDASAIPLPPAGAAPPSVTVQLLAPNEANVAGVQKRLN
jgi:hypothetical protein